MDSLWGIIIVVAGVFVCAFGNKLFRLVLAVLGFGLGFILSWWFTGSQPELIHILVSLVAGAIGAVLLYSLFRVGIHIAGGILGLVLGFLLVALLNLGNTSFAGIVLIAAAALVGFFGNLLSNMIVPLATGAAGAFMVAYGLTMIFAGEVAAGTNPIDLLASPLALAVFAVIVAISTLSQIPLRGTKVVRTVR
jgi:hypothetical protein